MSWPGMWSCGGLSLAELIDVEVSPLRAGDNGRSDSAEQAQAQAVGQRQCVVALLRVKVQHPTTSSPSARQHDNSLRRPQRTEHVYAQRLREFLTTSAAPQSNRTVISDPDRLYLPAMSQSTVVALPLCSKAACTAILRKMRPSIRLFVSRHNFQVQIYPAGIPVHWQRIKRRRSQSLLAFHRPNRDLKQPRLPRARSRGHPGNRAPPPTVGHRCSRDRKTFTERMGHAR